MYIGSEITGKKYDTVEECLAAEKKFKDKEKNKEVARDKAFEAINEYFDNGGTFNDLMELFNNRKILNKDCDFIWRFL